MDYPSPIRLNFTYGGWGIFSQPRCNQYQNNVGVDFFMGRPHHQAGDCETGGYDGRWEGFIIITDNPSGEPRIIREPSLSLPAPDGVGQIVEATVIDINGNVMERLNWSELVFKQKREFSLSSEGDLIVDGNICGRLVMLLTLSDYGHDGKLAFKGIFLDDNDVENLPPPGVHDIETLACELAATIIANAG